MLAARRRNRSADTNESPFCKDGASADHDQPFKVDFWSTLPRDTFHTACLTSQKPFRSRYRAKQAGIDFGAFLKLHLGERIQHIDVIVFEAKKGSGFRARIGVVFQSICESKAIVTESHRILGSVTVISNDPESQRQVKAFQKIWGDFTQIEDIDSKHVCCVVSPPHEKANADYFFLVVLSTVNKDLFEGAFCVSNQLLSLRPFLPANLKREQAALNVEAVIRSIEFPPSFNTRTKKITSFKTAQQCFSIVIELALVRTIKARDIQYIVDLEGDIFCYLRQKLIERNYPSLITRSRETALLQLHIIETVRGEKKAFPIQFDVSLYFPNKFHQLRKVYLDLSEPDDNFWAKQDGKLWAGNSELTSEQLVYQWRNTWFRCFLKKQIERACSRYHSFRQCLQLFEYYFSPLVEDCISLEILLLSVALQLEIQLKAKELFRSPSTLLLSILTFLTTYDFSKPIFTPEIQASAEISVEVDFGGLRGLHPREIDILTKIWTIRKERHIQGPYIASLYDPHCQMLKFGDFNALLEYCRLILENHGKVGGWVAAWKYFTLFLKTKSQQHDVFKCHVLSADKMMAQEKEDSNSVKFSKYKNLRHLQALGPMGRLLARLEPEQFGNRFILAKLSTLEFKKALLKFFSEPPCPKSCKLLAYASEVNIMPYDDEAFNYFILVAKDNAFDVNGVNKALNVLGEGVIEKEISYEVKDWEALKQSLRHSHKRIVSFYPEVFYGPTSQPSEVFS